MTINETDLNVAADRLVQREVILCLSGMVATLAGGHGYTLHPVSQSGTKALSELTQHAFELCLPVPDYEEAARQAGWSYCAKSEAWTKDGADDFDAYYSDAEDLCDGERLDAYEWEVFEHWAVSPWLAEKLAAEGERVDTDFAALNVWGRTTTGQSISMDAVIRKIAADLHKAAVDDFRDATGGAPQAEPAPPVQAAAGAERPWTDCKVAFGIDDPDTFEAWMDRTRDGAGLLPEGWSLCETDGAGARYVAVFRIEGALTDDDGRAVAEMLRREAGGC